MNALKSPRLWLLVWSVLGAAAVLYVIVASSAKQGRDAAEPPKLSHALATGAMAKFEFAIAPQPAPDIAFADAAGKAVTFADRRGAVLLVNFWATWCAPCLEELPSLDALARARGGEDFAVVAIAADPRGPEVAQAFLEKIGVKSLPLHMDSNLRLASAMGAGAGLPLTILYDRRGREIGRLRGAADWSSAEAARLVDAAVAAR